MSKYEVDVLVNNRPVKKYGHEGRTYIEARDGTEYTVRVKNNTSSRIETPVTIDGLDIIKGELGTKDSRGYLTDAYRSSEFKGWRETDDQVRAFKFATKEKSYAANSEETNYSDEHCGAIGVAIFSEKPKPAPVVIREKEYIYRDRPVYWPRPYPVPYYPPYREPYITWCSTATGTGDVTNDSFRSSMQCRTLSQSTNGNHASVMSFSRCADESEPLMQKSSVKFDMGTEFSDKTVQDKVRSVAFERGDHEESIVIYYASRKQLEAMGIDFDKEVSSTLPDPFPKDSGRYCKPPRKN